MDAAGELWRLLSTSDPVLLVIAGPNGAGKTTFFEASLERQLRIPFVNADRIARTVRTGGGADAKNEVAFRAAQLMREQLVASRVTFCMETVFSDPVGDKLAFFRAAQAAGYVVSMVFIGLASAELSARNLACALRFLDQVIVLDNSAVVDLYREIAVFERGKAMWLAEELPGWFQAIAKASVRRR